MLRNFLNSRGFTLVEVLASVVLLAVVITLSLSIFPNMFRTNDVNEQSLDAVAVAKDVLVKAKSSYYETSGYEVRVAGPNEMFRGVEIPQDHLYIIDSSYSPLTALIIVDNQFVDGLNLFETTIHIYKDDTIRATNYGYLVEGNLNELVYP
ncbi:type II secretion system protein J [Chryseomicrobium palamuruense]|uniref:Type II secretion system protein J n=1 Tax=Chryseomicrobium palamuruense TaxID=682973 RepID=A0ABV8UXE4_9BACL